MKYSMILLCFFVYVFAFLGASDFPLDLSTLDIPSTELMRNVFSELTKRFPGGILESFSLQSDIRHKSLLLLVILDVLEKYKSLSKTECADQSVVAGICDEIVVSFVKTAQSIQAGNTNVIKKKRWFKKRYLLAALFLLGGIALTIGITVPIVISIVNRNRLTAGETLVLLADELEEKERIPLELFEIEHACEFAACMFEEAESEYAAAEIQREVIEIQKVKTQKIEARRERIWFETIGRVADMFEAAEEECKMHEERVRIEKEMFVEIGTQTVAVMAKAKVKAKKKQIVKHPVLVSEGTQVDLDETRDVSDESKEDEPEELESKPKMGFFKRTALIGLESGTNGFLAGLGLQKFDPLAAGRKYSDL